MTQQTALFGLQPRTFADDDRGRIVYYPGVFSLEESERLFKHFEATLPWAQETMWMYDRSVVVPRLIARFDSGAALPPELAAVQAKVENVLGTCFTSASVQYYRDQNDSVAWHSDHTEDLIDLPVVALLSLGGVREMHVRTKRRPRRTLRCDLDPGSLFVMSGRAQEYYEHHVPKLNRPTRPRISVALRQNRVR